MNYELRRSCPRPPSSRLLHLAFRKPEEPIRRGLLDQPLRLLSIGTSGHQANLAKRAKGDPLISAHPHGAEPARDTVTLKVQAQVESPTVIPGTAASKTFSLVNLETRVAGQIADDAAWHTARNAKTAATVDWTVPPFLADGINTSPDFAAVIQEVVNRPGWVSGNAINIFWDDEDNQSDIGAYRPGRAYEYEGGQGDAPVLEITYGYPVGTATGVEGGFGSSLAVAPGRHGAY